MNYKKELFFRLAKLVSFILAFVFIGSISTAYAFSLVAQVGIINVKFVPSSDPGSYTISFDIQNGPQIQTGVRYSVMLVPPVGTSSSAITDGLIVDQKVYQRILTLLPNSITHRTVNYTVPPFLKGDYRLLIVSKDQSGLPLASALVSNLSVTPTTQGIFIDPTSCYLTIASSTDTSQYNLVQGVDILPSETLTLSCRATNLSSSQQIVSVPSFETNLRTNFGARVAGASDSQQISNIVFNPNETKLITVSIPKPANPQAYDSVFNLVSVTGGIISNSITTHWVLDGASATVQSVTVDKTYYLKGDTATVSFMWSGSADAFGGSRIGTGTPLGVVTANVYLCGYTKNIPLSGTGGTVSVEIPIQSDCQSPAVSLSLLNNGNELSQATSTVSDPAAAGLFSSMRAMRIQKDIAEGALGVGITALIAVLVIILRKRKNALKVVAFLLLGGAAIVSALGIKAPSAYAANYTFTVTGGGTTYSCMASSTLATINSSLPTVKPSIGANGVQPNSSYNYEPGQDLFLNTTATTSSALNTFACSYKSGSATTTLTQKNGGLILSATYGISSTTAASYQATTSFTTLFPVSLSAADSLLPLPSLPAVAGVVFGPTMYVHMLVTLSTPQGAVVASSTNTNSTIFVGPAPGNTVTISGSGLTWDQGTISGLIDPITGDSLYATVALSNGGGIVTNQFYPGSGIGFVDDFTTRTEGCTNGASDPVYLTMYLIRSSDNKIMASTTSTNQYAQNQFNYLTNNEQALLAPGSYYLEAVFSMSINLYHNYVDPHYVLGTLIIPLNVSTYPYNLAVTSSPQSVGSGNSSTSVSWNNIATLFPLSLDQANGGALSYNLYRTSSTSSVPVLVTTINNVSSSSPTYQYTDNGLQANSAYSYLLQLVDFFGTYPNGTSEDPNAYGGSTWVPESSPVSVTTGQYVASTTPISGLCSITASPANTTAAGLPSTLSWSSSGFNSCIINNTVVSSTSGSIVVSPQSTTGYALQCQSSATPLQMCSATTTITVPTTSGTSGSSSAPGSVTLDIDGASSTSMATGTLGVYPTSLGLLSWTSTNEASCSNITSVPAGYFSSVWNGAVTATSSNAGTNVVGPYASYPSPNPITYTISCMDTGGRTNTSSATLILTAPAPAPQSVLCSPIANATICPYEGTALTGLGSSTAIGSAASCSASLTNPLPAMCQYYCSVGYTLLGNQCIAGGTVKEQ